MKKVLSVFICFIIMLTLASCGNKKTNIVSTCYAGYDLARNISGDKKTSSMLLNPGEELHDYSPSVGDIERIISSEIFIYIGGESDSEWVEKDILPEIDKNKTTVINMMDVVKNGGYTYDEENPESAEETEEEGEEEEEYDEHVWNSITNAKLISSSIYEALISLDNDNKDYYKENYDKLINDLDEVDNDIKDVISNSSKNLLIFADRFPLLYFVKEYGLEYDAAFKGCESSKEANPKTINSLSNKIKNNNIKVIFIIELSESKIADTIIKELKNDNYEVSKRTFYTMHNVSKNDYKNKKSYIDFMKDNIESLRIALS